MNSTPSTAQGRSATATAGRLGLLLAAALLVTVPIAQGLVWSWQVHPVLVVPTYVLGIPVWLTVIAWAWAGVRRVQGLVTGSGTPVAPEEDTITVTSPVRVPAPRAEVAPMRVTTPTP